ncbi:MFS transporter [uncultured Sphingomonas sp.]|uniref:spinster family MFS transporter n=1 Tax=uncultured Sphingomonas sp. TaxID=158754 RepID=UPI002600B836|nr:MFS transporter [uncultured Sphingomonas sp.]
MPKRYGAIALLTFIYVLNFVDRQLVGILAQPIKADLGLSDRELGLLTGVAFALFYTTLALPIARVAERRNRTGVIALSLGVWSAMTALCGFARGVPQLMLARIGVGLGEAGYAPAAQSLIADLVRPERRATALSIFSLGIPIGMLVGAVAGGWLGQTLGWRMAFIALGVPGILLALLVPLVIREPERGKMDRAQLNAAPSFAHVVQQLWAAPGFLHMAAGATLSSFAGYGVTSFAVSLLMRGRDLGLAQAASGFGLVAGGAVGIGIAAGGWLSDSQRRSGSGRVAAGGAVVAGLCFSVALIPGAGLTQLAVCGGVGLAGAHLYFGPTYGLTVNSVGPQSRATAIAILLMLMNAVGLGLGPLTVGALSDHFARADDAAYGLATALRLTVLLYVWAALHFAMAGRALRRGQPHNSAR